MNKNVLTWLAGLSLSKDGEILEAKNEKQKCMVSFQAHGAAHELMLTAMYHAVYEFGETEGAKYKILAADKAVPLQLFLEDERIKDKVKPYMEQYKRRPDLILEGDGKGKRIWIEAKSNMHTTVKFEPWKPPNEAGFKDRSSPY